MRKIFLVLIFLHYSTGAGAVVCQDLFGDFNLTKSISELAELRVKLDLDKASNQGNLVTSALERNFFSKEIELIKYLEDRKIMSRNRFFEVLKTEISKIQVSDRQKNELEKTDRTRTEIQIPEIIDGTTAVFFQNNGGTVKIFGKDQAVEPFAMMATTITEQIWQEVVKLAMKHFGPTYRNKLTLFPSDNGGDLYPVIKISYRDVEIWVQALNEISAAGVPELLKIFPSHQHRDKYDIPTRAQFEFILRKMGTSYEKFYFGETLADLENHAWLKTNSGGDVKPVAGLAPLTLGDHLYYDLLGNVSQFVKVPEFNVNGEIFGGNVSYSPDTLVDDPIMVFERIQRSLFVGFRLVKTKGK